MRPSVSVRWSETPGEVPSRQGGRVSGELRRGRATPREGGRSAVPPIDVEAAAAAAAAAAGKERPASKAAAAAVPAAARAAAAPALPPCEPRQGVASPRLSRGDRSERWWQQWARRGRDRDGHASPRRDDALLPWRALRERFERAWAADGQARAAGARRAACDAAMRRAAALLEAPPTSGGADPEGDRAALQVAREAAGTVRLLHGRLAALAEQGRREAADEAAAAEAERARLEREDERERDAELLEERRLEVTRLQAELEAAEFELAQRGRLVDRQRRDLTGCAHDAHESSARRDLEQLRLRLSHTEVQNRLDTEANRRRHAELELQRLREEHAAQGRLVARLKARERELVTELREARLPPPATASHGTATVGSQLCRPPTPRRDQRLAARYAEIVPRGFVALLSGFKGAREHTVRPLSLSQLRHRLASLFAARRSADVAARAALSSSSSSSSSSDGGGAAASAVPLPTLAEFVYERFVGEAGERRAAELRLMDLFVSVEKFAAACPRVRAFRRFCQYEAPRADRRPGAAGAGPDGAGGDVAPVEAWSTQLLAAYLRLVQLLEVHGTGPFLGVSDNEAGVTWLDLSRVVDILCEALAGLPAASVRGVVEGIARRVERYSSRSVAALRSPGGAAAAASAAAGPPLPPGDLLRRRKNFVSMGDALEEVMLCLARREELASCALRDALAVAAEARAASEMPGGAAATDDNMAEGVRVIESLRGEEEAASRDALALDEFVETVRASVGGGGGGGGGGLPRAAYLYAIRFAERGATIDDLARAAAMFGCVPPVVLRTELGAASAAAASTAIPVAVPEAAAAAAEEPADPAAEVDPADDTAAGAADGDAAGDAAAPASPGLPPLVPPSRFASSEDVVGWALAQAREREDSLEASWRARLKAEQLKHREAMFRLRRTCERELEVRTNAAQHTLEEEQTHWQERASALTSEKERAAFQLDELRRQARQDLALMERDRRAREHSLQEELRESKREAAELAAKAKRTGRELEAADSALRAALTDMALQHARGRRESNRGGASRAQRERLNMRAADAESWAAQHQAAHSLVRRVSAARALRRAHGAAGSVLDKHDAAAAHRDHLLAGGEDDAGQGEPAAP